MIDSGLVCTAANVKSWIYGLKSWGFLELLGSNFLVVNPDRRVLALLLPMLNPGFQVSRFEVILNCCAWIRGLVFAAADVKSWISGLKSWGFLELLVSNFLVVNPDRRVLALLLPMLNPGFYKFQGLRSSWTAVLGSEVWFLLLPILNLGFKVWSLGVFLNCLVQTSWLILTEWGGVSCCQCQTLDSISFNVWGHLELFVSNWTVLGSGVSFFTAADVKWC